MWRKRSSFHTMSFNVSSDSEKSLGPWQRYLSQKGKGKGKGPPKVSKGPGKGFKGSKRKGLGRGRRDSSNSSSQGGRAFAQPVRDVPRMHAPLPAALYRSESDETQPPPYTERDPNQQPDVCWKCQRAGHNASECRYNLHKDLRAAKNMPRPSRR